MMLIAQGEVNFIAGVSFRGLSVLLPDAKAFGTGEARE
jgi:hypothetical protein